VKRGNRRSASGLLTRSALSLAEPNPVVHNLKFDFGIREQSNPVADLLRDGDLAFARDPHEIILTSNYNTQEYWYFR
jgi:hypothetical protein